MEYKVVEKIIKVEFQVKLSYDEMRLLRNALDQINAYQHGMTMVQHDLRDKFNEALLPFDKLSPSG